ncbi:MAG: NUDIX hydrolase [Parachlamydiaceae bacterium]
MRQYIFSFFLFFSFFNYSLEASSFFQASANQPYHLSIGAVLFNDKGHIACHRFKNILGHRDIYILMRESMENGEEILSTLARGLQEEFGATGQPIVFLGALTGTLNNLGSSFEKTTLYVLCQLQNWDVSTRDPNDPEAISTIEWLSPEQLISLMEEQGRKFKRVDADESEIIRRAVPYIRAALSQN